MSVSPITKFVSLLEQSNLLTAEKLDDVRSLLTNETEPQQLARQLADDGLLTRWQADMLLAGRSAFFLGRYKLLSQLGQGGMGTVFKAEQTPLGRLVAVKLMARRLIKDADAMARFRREIEAVAALSHPNIVAALDADSVGDDHFLVMEYVEGQDLRQVLKCRSRQPVSPDNGRGAVCRRESRPENHGSHHPSPATRPRTMSRHFGGTRFNRPPDDGD